MQFQAAAYAALEILEAKSQTDRVYCDWHDDFVVRKTTSSGVEYHFFQVKTKAKGNELWSVLHVFALKKRKQGEDAESLEAVRKSFAGKLLIHTLRFEGQCKEVTFLTNVHCEDDLLDLVKELGEGDVKSKHAQFLVKNFSIIFEGAPGLGKQQILDALAKLKLQSAVRHIGSGSELADFTRAAHQAIYRYSEIDLTQPEVADIAKGLVELVHRKSHAQVLATMTPDQLESAVSVDLQDLLSVLSISTQAYEHLRAGGDPHALKHASIIQRMMKAAGAADRVVEYLSERKVEWDLWMRNERHSVLDLDFETILDMVGRAEQKWAQSGGTLEDVHGILDGLLQQQLVKKHVSLTREVLLGGMMAALVRRATR